VTAGPRKFTVGLDPVRAFPYYKIQVWNPKASAWKDIQKRFDSLLDLRAFARAAIVPGTLTRIMIVESYGSRRVAEDLSVDVEEP